jgi:tetratricopeptide (TPR) repeat protein
MLEALNVIKLLLELLDRTSMWWQQRRRPGWNPGAEQVRAGSIGIPQALLPASGVYGHQQLKARLFAAVGSRRGRDRLLVLVGMGGTGKSTLAVLASNFAKEQRKYCRVWCVRAVDRQSFVHDMAAVARALHASADDLQAIMSSSDDAPDRVWRLLEYCRGWVLVVDNLDSPTLARELQPWLLRPHHHGVVLVTSRLQDDHLWSPVGTVLPVEALSIETATTMLLKEAPDAGSRADAAALAKRLGGLPLGLQLATQLLSSVFEPQTFAELHRLLDTMSLGDVFVHQDEVANPALHHTFDLSLQAAMKQDAAAYAVLRLVSCLAPATPIPVNLLDGTDITRPTGRNALSALIRAGLIQEAASKGARPGTRAIVVHPLVADANRSLLDARVAPSGSLPLDPEAIRNSAVELVTHAFDELTGGDVVTAANRPAFSALLAHLRQLLSCQPDCFDTPHTTMLITTTSAAAELVIYDRDEKAASALLQAAAAHAQQLPRDDHVALQLQHTDGRVHLQLGDLAHAEQCLRQVWHDRQRVLGTDHADTLESQRQLGWTLAERGQLGDAELLFDGILERMTELPIPAAAQLHVRCMYSWILYRQGKLPEAEASYQALITDREELLGTNHPDTLDARHSLARVLLADNKIEVARATLEDVLTRRQCTLGCEHPDTIESRKYLLLTTFRASSRRPFRRRFVQRQLQEIVQQQQHTLGQNHPNTLDTLRHLASLRSKEDS